MEEKSTINEKIFFLTDSIRIEDQILEENYNSVVLLRKDIFPFETSGISTGIEGNKIPMLIRKETQYLIKRGLNEKKSRFVLTGYSGAGKSYALFHIAYFFYHQPNWIVLYLPNIADLMTQPSWVIAKRIMRYLYSSYKKELFEIPNGLTYDDIWKKILPTSEEKEQMVEVCQTCVFSLISGFFGEYKFCLCLDQWNFLYREERSNHLLEIFHSVPQIEQGFFCAAVSSSFSPISKLNDSGEFSEIEFPISIYTEEELKSIISYLKDCNHLPEQMKFEEIQQFTENVPRILFYLSQSYQQRIHSNRNSNLNININLNWKSCAEEKAITFYQDRIFHILTKKKENNQKNILNETNSVILQHDSTSYEIVPIDFGNLPFAAELYLNRDILNLSKIWKNAGIFIEKNNTFQFISKFARKAFYLEFETNFTNYIQALASNPNTSYYAFELFVSNSLNRCFFHGFLIHTTDLFGENSTTFQIKINRRIFQENLQSIQKLEPGTFIVCFSNHPVVDFIIFSENRQLFFIQASISSYSNHLSKLQDLWKIKMPNTNQSVLEFYSNLTGIPNNKKCLDFHQFYIYITSNQDLAQHITDNSSQPVHLINRDRLSSLNKELWDRIQKCYKDSDNSKKK